MSRTLPSANLPVADCSMMSSISQMSSFPPFRMQGSSPPRSLLSAMSSHISRPLVISWVNRRPQGKNRHHALAAHVPAQDHHVGFVEGRRVPEFAPADLGAVNVRGEEAFH